MRGEFRQAPHVPGQALPEPRVKEPPERNIQPGEHGAEILEERGIGRATGQQFAGQVAHQAGRIAPLASGDRADLPAQRRGIDARHRQRRILFGEVLQHPQLTISRLRARIEIQDFEDVVPPIGGMQVKVAVALAGQRAHRHAKSVGIPRDALDLRLCEYRRRGPQGEQSFRARVVSRRNRRPIP